MPGGRPKLPVVLSVDERQTLEVWARRPKSTQRLATRAKIILACADGQDNKQVAARLGLTLPMVGKWRARFLEHRLNSLVDEPRPGGPPQITDAPVEEVVTPTPERRPGGATHLRQRSMAQGPRLLPE